MLAASKGAEAVDAANPVHLGVHLASDIGSVIAPAELDAIAPSNFSVA